MTSERLDPRPTLVTGATGKTGRRVAARLQALGHAVRAGSRSATPRFDWDAPDTWHAALAGTRAAYVAYVPDLAVPGAPAAIERFVDTAAAVRLERIVLLSGRGEPEARACERIVQAGPIPATVLRCSWFAQNFSENFLRDGVLAGELALPVGAVAEPFVDADDIADVAVAALTGDGHAGQVYELTGPRLWTFGGAVAEIGRVTGRRIQFRRVSVDDYAAGLRAQGLPEDVVGLVTYLFTEVLDGRNASLADGVMRALGRAPRDFADYVRDAAAAGAWGSRDVAA